MRLRSIALVAVLVLGSAVKARAAVTIDRQFGYDDGRLTLRNVSGTATLSIRGALREPRAGFPDLPVLSESVLLPAGMKVAGIEVTELATRVVVTGVRVDPALVPRPGLGPIERSLPDAGIYAAATPQPAEVVALGAQGNERGRNVAWLRVNPVRWNPSTGEVQVVTRLGVRLTLAADDAPVLRRERIVPEWEDDGPLVPAARRGSAAPAAAVRRGGAVPFSATQLPSLLGSPVAYVIVTNDAMAPTFQQLADWKTQTGVPAVVRTMSFIRQQYPAAADDAERVRTFIRDAYTRWGTKWVLLGGDTDVIPTRLAMTTFYGGEMIATDLYFSCLDGNWDADGDSLFGEGYISGSSPGDNCDLLPEVYVGRATVSTAAAAQVFVDKTMQYVKTPLGNYEQNWMFMAEVLFPQPWNQGDPVSLDGAALAESMMPLTDQHPSLHVIRLYENYTDTVWRPGSLLENYRSVMDTLNTGPQLVLHVGHGYRNVMEVGDASLTNADASSLTNGDRLFNLYAINCTSSAIDFPCIAEAFMANPNGGAVTNVGSTRFDFPSTGEAYQYEYFRMFLEDGVDAVGELQARQKLAWIPYSSYDGVNRWTQMTLILLGDPELRMWLGQPGTIAVTAPSSVALSDTQFTVHVDSSGSPLANARVTAYKAGDDYVSLLTNASGDATVPFRPDSIGSFTLTVTARNARPWQSAVAITASAAAALVEAAAVIDDDAVGGTSGDANGIVDAGETVDVVVPIKNQGGTAASGVTADLTTTDGLVTIVTPSASYGSIAPGATASPAAGFRVSFPYTLADQREVPFTVTIADGAGQTFREHFQLTVHAPELRSFSHGVTEIVGNGDGRAQVGETVNYFVRLYNRGSGTAHGVTIVARSYDGLAVVSDSTSSLGDVAPNEEKAGDAITFQLTTSLTAKLDLLLSDSMGPLGTQRLDMIVPAYPSKVIGLGAATSIDVAWTHSSLTDLYGYNVYRSSASGGPYAKVNPIPTGRIATYTDANLAPLTRYYYQVSCVDSSGNESLMSATVSTSTNPPTHTVFPVPMSQNTPAPTAIEHFTSTQTMDIAAGSEVLYVWHADGTPLHDADGIGTTLGDFSTRGRYFAAGPSIATLNPAQGWSVIGASWDSAAVYVFDRNGDVRSGWPVAVDPSGLWGSVACGDVDGDGIMELFFPSNGTAFYGVHADGSEILDGDANPSTHGVFKLMGAGYNYSSPALADLDGDGLADIIVGGRDGWLYAWKGNGANVPGFPRWMNAEVTGSPAVAYLDGTGDTSPEIVIGTTADSLCVIQANGTSRPGWPLWVRGSGTSKTPSPAIADLNNDGYLDIVYQSTNGALYCYNRNAQALPGLWNVRYSSKTSGASECSPVVADIDGDGFNDIITGDENGVLNAISGANGQVMPGFPIQLQGEVRGTPAVGDIDDDGKTEVLVAGWDKNLYVWDYDFTFQPSGQAPWPQFHHDARRTGYYNAPVFLAVDEGAAGARDVRTLELAAPAPNPAVRSARLSFAVPATLGGRAYELSIYDLGGRRVRRVDAGLARAGRVTQAWDLRDDAARAVAGGVYFARLTVGGQSVVRKLVVVP